MGPVCLDGADGHDRHRLRPVEVANLLPGQVREVEDCHRVAVSYRARRLTASRPRPISVTMSFQPPEQCNIADYILDAIEYFYAYTRARVVVAHRDTVGAFRRAARGARHLKTILVLGDNEFDERLARAPAALDPFPTHRDDAAIWLFSGGTTGQPK